MLSGGAVVELESFVVGDDWVFLLELDVGAEDEESGVLEGVDDAPVSVGAVDVGLVGVVVGGLVVVPASEELVDDGGALDDDGSEPTVGSIPPDCEVSSCRTDKISATFCLAIAPGASSFLREVL